MYACVSLPVILIARLLKCVSVTGVNKLIHSLPKLILLSHHDRMSGADTAGATFNAFLCANPSSQSCLVLHEVASNLI